LQKLQTGCLNSILLSTKKIIQSVYGPNIALTNTWGRGKSEVENKIGEYSQFYILLFVLKMVINPLTPQEVRNVFI